MADWKNDQELKTDLQDYVHRNFQRLEILDFVEQKYTMYHWSLRTLCRIEKEVDVAQVEDAVRKEMDGPGRLLIYQAMHKKVREIHKLNVPRNLVYDVMTEINPEGPEARGNVGKPRRPKRNHVFIAEVMKLSIVTPYAQPRGKVGA
jgi:transposase